MMERPILFSDEMVRAILDGRKTQTRRPVKSFRIPTCAADVSGPDGYDVVQEGRIVRKPWTAKELGLLSPYHVGDRLWVREAWRLGRINGASGTGGEFADIQYRTDWNVMGYRRDWRPLYAHLLTSEKRWTNDGVGNLWGAWRPSIHMPRWASRILLTVTDIRVERVQDITEADAQAEGVTRLELSPRIYQGLSVHPMTSTQVEAYRVLWDHTYAKRGFAWDSNPWVWVVTFSWETP